MTLPNRHLVLISCFALISLAAASLVRLEYLAPDVTVLLPDVLGQLRGLSQSLLFYFILLPLLPTVIAYRGLSDRLPYPRLASAAWGLLLLGAGLLASAFATGGIESGWMYAVSSPVTRSDVSLSFLLGLMCACIAMQLVSLNLLAGLNRKQDTPSLGEYAFKISAWLFLITLPVLLASLVIALGQKVVGPGGTDAAASSLSLLPARLYAFTQTPLQTAVLLPALGLAASALLPGSSERLLKRLMVGLAAISVLAVEQNVSTGSSSAFFQLTASFYHSLLALGLLLFAGCLLRRAFIENPRLLRSEKASQLYAGATAAVLLLFGPLSLMLNTLGVRDVFASGYLSVAQNGLLILMVFLSFLSGMFAFREQTTSAKSRLVPIKVALALLLLGILATLPPLLALGRSALPSTITAYPEGVQQLQLAVTFGGSLLLIALLVNLGVASLSKGP